ncbi:MAG: helix-turn-helix transcriptional regulator [Clostridia bacterium]|nr:helix-turn-helix transcriptional regulator [Clostridia bacterium]
MDELDAKIETGKNFIRSRITQLRLKADVSEYQMSYDLGQNRGYIQAISSGKAMPSMTGFLNICDYFNITPLEFFDHTIEEPELVNEIVSILKTMNEDDLLLLKEVLTRIAKK